MTVTEQEVTNRESPQHQARPTRARKDGDELHGLSAAVSVIVPAYNEVNGIAKQITSVQRALEARAGRHEIVVVDDGSTDGTGSEARHMGVRVLRHPVNRGYGAALKTGIAAALYETIVIIDADGTYPTEDIPSLVDKLQTADMVVGARRGEEVNIPWMRRPGKQILRWLASYVAERPIPDLNSGLRAFRRDCIQQYFPVLSDRFSFTTTSTLSLLADDYHIVYHPINYYRRTGKSKINPRHFLDFVILVLRMTMMFQPLRVFVPLSFGFGLLGLLKVIYDTVTLFLRAGEFSWALLYQPTLSTSAVLFLIAGLQLLMMGMIADGVVRRMAQHNRPPVPSRAVYEDRQEPPLSSGQ